MAILRGFPPSNTISPGPRILDDDDPNKKCYIHLQNEWVSRKDDLKRYRNDIQSLLERLEKFNIAFHLGEKLTDDLVDVAVRASKNFEFDLMDDGSAPWFVWFEYHVVHALSRMISQDLRPLWMKSWDWQATDQWCQARTTETLDDITPLDLMERKAGQWRS